VLDIPARGPRFGWSAKLGPIATWAAGRPLVWIDDQLHGKEPGWAETRRDDHGIATLLITPHPGRGLERGHVDTICTWLDADGGTQLRRG
jgi:hypothetical protein